VLRGFKEFGDLQETEAMPRGKAAALEALRLDPQLSQAHTWLGDTLSQAWGAGTRRGPFAVTSGGTSTREESPIFLTF